MKKCLIVVNTKKKDSQTYGKMISEYLSTKGIFSSFYSFDGFSEDDPFSGVDFVVTLGGDGTVLFAA
ncbi:MAG: NAD(+)/NADH kinase, partial [Treponema sp.]